MKKAYRAIAGRIRTELQELTQVVERTTRIWQQASMSANDYYVDATALKMKRLQNGCLLVLLLIAMLAGLSRPASTSGPGDEIARLAEEAAALRDYGLAASVRERMRAEEPHRKVRVESADTVLVATADTND
jgi:hypothetical protein